MEHYHRNAIAFNDLKNAALYFDGLVPVSIIYEILIEEENWLPPEGLFRSLLPQGLASKQFAVALGEVNLRAYAIAEIAAKRKLKFESTEDADLTPEFDRLAKEFVTAFLSFVQTFGLGNWPLALDLENNSGSMLNDEVEEPSSLLTISLLRLVDASQASWEHIAEIRKDAIARERLRRLRLFAFENYSGKSRAFVEDDLLSRISDYEASAKEWGLGTVQGTLSLVLNSKLAAGALAGSFVSALFGQPIAALIAGATGATLEVTGVVLELERRRLGLQSLARENPVSYISYMREHVGVAMLLHDKKG